MRTKRMSAKRWMATVAVLTAALVGCDLTFVVDVELWLGKASESISETYAFDGVETVRVGTANGEIRVTVDPNATEVLVAGTKTARGEDDAAAQTRLDDIEIRIVTSGEGNTVLEIEALLEEVSGQIRDEVDFAITLPAGADLELETDNGAITVIDNEGQVAAVTSNGKITVTDNTGAIDVTSSNGELVLTGIVGAVKGVTSNGKITVEAAIAGTEAVDVQTSNGAIDIEVPAATTKADLDLSTKLGRVVTELQDFTITNLETATRSVTATLNGGGGLIKARSSNGWITFSGM